MMKKQNKFQGLVHNHAGQQMVEYTLLFVAVVLVIYFAMGPDGFFRKAIANSMDMSVSGIEAMANSVNVDRYK